MRRRLRGSLELRSDRGRLNEAGQRILRCVDTQDVIRVAVEEVLHSLRLRSASLWLTDGRDTPHLAYAADPLGKESTIDASAAPPAGVLTCARTERPSHNSLVGDLSVPVVGPQSGLVGVLHLSGRAWATEHVGLVETIARETGLALEMSHLYERALAEKEKSEAILARVSDGVLVTNASGVAMQWNPAAERIVGHPTEVFLGRRCESVLGLHVGERALDCANGCPLLAAAPVGSDPTAESAESIEAWRQSGDRRQPLHVSVEAIHSPDGGEMEVVHSIRDITTLKEADEAKTLFLATATHELKTPLTVIRGFVETLIHHPNVSDELRTTALETIERRTVELSAIIDRLLLTSRIESGQIDLTVTDVDLRPIIAERVNAFATSAGHSVTVDVPEDLIPARAEANAFITVLDHLLDNAFKYAPNGGSIAVSADATERGVQVRVTDHGIGMDADQSAHCFDKFWQREKGHARRFGGTGIGLYIVKSLVEAMGAEVWVQSALGEGSTFTIALQATGSGGGSPPRTPEAPIPGIAEQSSILEVMRQIGIPARRPQ